MWPKDKMFAYMMPTFTNIIQVPRITIKSKMAKAYIPYIHHWEIPGYRLLCVGLSRVIPPRFLTFRIVNQFATSDDVKFVLLAYNKEKKKRKRFHKLRTKHVSGSTWDSLRGERIAWHVETLLWRIHPIFCMHSGHLYVADPSPYIDTR